MPDIARCPSCGGPLSETSVLALAPVCDHCRGVVVERGGTMGLIGAYGVSDQTITRRRVEADLSILRETLANYNGMKESCKDQLTWDVGKYAELPEPPELLRLEPVPNLWGENPALSFLVLMPFGWAMFCIPGLIVAWIISSFSASAGRIAFLLVGVIWLIITIVMIYEQVAPHLRAVKANGEKPAENARRQEAYEKKRLAALKLAEPIKAAQDHRLKSQIIELEGLEKTVRKIEVEVDRELRKLG